MAKGDKKSDKKHQEEKVKEDTLSRKHWSLKCHESLVFRNADGAFRLIIEGGAEEGLFPLIGDIEQKKIKYRSGKVFQGELILEVNKMRVPGMIQRDVAALIRSSSEPLALVTVKQNASITRSISEYLAIRFTKSSVDNDLQQQIRHNLYTRVVPCTTRMPHADERPGVDYKFISTEEFKELEASGSLLESGMFEGNFYGTPKPSGNPPPLDGGSEEYRTTSPSSFNTINRGAMPSNVALGPLPANWEIVYTEDWQKYFIDHNTETTHWIDPRLSCVQKCATSKGDDDASTKGGATGTSPKPMSGEGSPEVQAKIPSTDSPPKVAEKQTASPNEVTEASAELAEKTKQHSEVEVAELRQQLELQNSSVQEWEDKYTNLEREFEHLRSTTELKCLRATAREREKWEAREERLLEQLRDLQQRIEVTASPLREEPDDCSTDHPVHQMDKSESDPESIAKTADITQPKHNSANWTDIDAVFEKVPAESEPDVSVKSLSSSYEEPPKPTTVTGAEDGALFGATMGSATGTSHELAMSAASSPAVAKVPSTGSPPEVAMKPAESPNEATEASAELAETTKPKNENWSSIDSALEKVQAEGRLSPPTPSVKLTQECGDTLSKESDDKPTVTTPSSVVNEETDASVTQLYKCLTEETLQLDLSYDVLGVTCNAPKASPVTSPPQKPSSSRLPPLEDTPPPLPATRPPPRPSAHHPGHMTPSGTGAFGAGGSVTKSKNFKTIHFSTKRPSVKCQEGREHKHESKASIARRPPIPAPYGTGYATPLVDSSQQTDLNSNRNKFHFDGENGFGKRMVQPRGPRKEPAHWQSWQFHAAINQS